MVAQGAEDSDGLDGATFYVGGVPVFPLTICRISLLVSLAKKCDEDVEQFVKLQAWILTTENIEERHVELREYKVAKRESKKAWRKLPWTPAQLEYAVTARFGEVEDGEDEQGGSYNPNSLIAMLVHDYGSTPDYWRFKATTSIINSIIDDWQLRQQAQAEAYNKSSGKNVAPLPSPKFRYARKRREAIAQLKKDWSDGETKD